MQEAYCFNKSFAPAGPMEFQTDRHYLLYALKGTIRLEAEGKRWTLPPARAALIKSGCPITITILTQLTSASVLFDPGFMAPPEHHVTVFDMSPLARALISECLAWGEDSGPLSPYARNLFQTLSMVALQLARAPSPCVMPAAQTPALKQALALTEEFSDSEVTFKDIAKECGQSERALSRRFSDELGLTWSEALRRIRIINAVEALASSDASVTEIAVAVGYSSLSGFNAAFRELMEMTPTQYRDSFETTRE